MSDRPTKLYAKNLHELPQSFDYCGYCKEFLPDVWVCLACFTPTLAAHAMKGQCRGRFAYVPCDMEEKQSSARKA